MKQGQRLTILAFFMTTALQAGTQDIARDTVLQHKSPDDCWIIIGGEVYDITTAVADHQRYRYALDPWCGKDATHAWETKDGKNKAHSRKAQMMLKSLHKGRLASP